MALKSDEPTVRVQFDMRESHLRTLEDVMERAGIDSRKEMFNQALNLLEWAVRQKQEGRMVASVDPTEGKFRELSMPILDKQDPRNAPSEGGADG